MKNNEKPDLEFITEGTKKIEIPKGIEEEFCPHVTYCLKNAVDSNCFYNKFLHCKTARELEETHPLSKRDAYYLRYRDVGIG